jgi:hypothetical protein
LRCKKGFTQSRKDAKKNKKLGGLGGFARKKAFFIGQIYHKEVKVELKFRAVFWAGGYAKIWAGFQDILIDGCP